MFDDDKATANHYLPVRLNKLFYKRMSTHKKIVVAVLLCCLVYASYNIVIFLVGMNKSFEFAQSQAKAGREFMDTMTQESYYEAAEYALKLMTKKESKTQNSHTIREVPEPWKSRGIIFIRYTPKQVSYCWHGGPHAHTKLILNRTNSETIKFIAHYTDYEERKELAEIKITEQNTTSNPLPAE